MGEPAEVAISTEDMEGHDVPPDVLTDVVHWLRKGCVDTQCTPSAELARYLRLARHGGTYCYNEGCEVMGQRKDFKVCPQCKTARYCGDACQKQDWTTGGHKIKCGTPHASAGVGRGTQLDLDRVP